MQLIGMLDSPYVRRVAISLRVLGLAFDLDQVSVFRHFDRFAAINPVVKAPSFVTDDGVVPMEFRPDAGAYRPSGAAPPDAAGSGIA
jgi:glutathione S-transferase